MFLAVSMNVSPFDRLLVEAEKSSVSAPSRRAASEKLFRVRVEFSKNRLTQVLPASRGIFRSPVGRRPPEHLGLVEDQRDFLGREVFEAQQVPPFPEVRDRAEIERCGGHFASPDFSSPAAAARWANALPRLGGRHPSEDDAVLNPSPLP